jgi:hypothetical protein
VLTRSILVVPILLWASVASAHHRQTPPIVAITTNGDASLPRLPPPSRKAAAVVIDGGTASSIAVVSPFATPTVPTFSFTNGDNRNPSISANGRVVAWDTDADPLASSAPGRQVIAETRAGLVQIAVDPTGTSANPSEDRYGLYVAFEATGDLAGTGNAGARQVFLHDPDGGVTQVSRGTGRSGNASIGPKARVAVFDSTSDPTTGADTGTAQIWLATLGGAAAALTAGAGDSRRPDLSDDSRLVVFDSRADLAGDGHDTGVPQIFAYDTVSKTFAQLTGDPGGCTDATTLRIMRDWRVGYLCGGEAYFTMLLGNQRFHVQTDGGDTTALVPQGDAHFVLVATTADLLAGTGTTSGHRVYMVNLFKRPPDAVPSAVTWFPSP